MQIFESEKMMFLAIFMRKKQANSKKRAADTIRLQYEEGSSE